ncbi:hypothetical protein [Armatimonas sp.]|uniref:hypothetical protein n=1 Tax=Armatimonas sp. TaxID=1872638 RepID=UPI00374CBC56
MSFPFTEFPDDDDRPMTIPAPDIAPGSTIEVQATYGPGRVMISFLTPGASYEVSLGLDTLSALIAALGDQLATASEFYDPEGGVFVDAPLKIVETRNRLVCPECGAEMFHHPDDNHVICANPFCDRDPDVEDDVFRRMPLAFEEDGDFAPDKPACPLCDHGMSPAITIGAMHCENCGFAPSAPQSRPLETRPAIKTMRQAHEEAAGMGLEESFFTFNRIDPNAPAPQDQTLSIYRPGATPWTSQRSCANPPPQIDGSHKGRTA